MKTAGEGDTYPSSHPPGSAPGHKLQRPSKESGIFQSLGTICTFLLKGKVKRGGGGGGWGWHNGSLPKYAPGGRSRFQISLNFKCIK